MQVWRRLRLFIQNAGKIIFLGSILLWFLLNFPQANPPDDLDEVATHQYQVEHSYAADIGRGMEPFTAPLGYDWRLNIGLLASFAARELMVSTMAQVYAYRGAEEDVAGLAARIAHPDSKTGKPAVSFATGLSLLVFFVFALLCVSTLAVIRRETNSWRWPIFTMSYMLAIAWIGAFIAFRLAS